MKTAGLKLNIQKIKIMAFWSHDFMANRWGKVETVTDFMFLGSKIPADSDCSLEIRYLLLGRRPVLHPWFGKTPWRREQLPTPVFWPGEFHWTV